MSAADYAVWQEIPPQPDEPDWFEQFCDAHGLPYTEESWAAFEQFIGDVTCDALR